MFGPNHYVPVLKLKQGEKRALGALPSSISSNVTPLWEVVERVPKDPDDPRTTPTLEKHLDTGFRGLAKAVAHVPRFFLDCREVVADCPVASDEVFARAAALATPLVPVTSVSRTADVASALAHAKHGLAIRLSRQEFESGTLPSAIPAFLSTHGLNPANIDLIVDLGAVDQMIGPGVEGLATAFLADVPNHASWRTFTISACGFPASMGGVDANSQAQVDRLEWEHWRQELFANRHALSRLPTFSDCGIQHRDGVEGFNPKTMKPSAAIRFAEANSWLLVKGVNIRDNGGEQFQNLADEVLGATGATASHCAGCAGLHAAAANPNGYKSLGKWRELGTIHHITLTVENLAGLPWP